MNYKKIIFFMSSFLFSLKILAADFEIIEDKCSLKILSLALQERKTAKIKLKNNLRAYLISDPKAVQSAVSLTINTGSWDDPKEYEGIAHFCEHMLFKGSSAYPNESDFIKYVMDRAGSPNAFTCYDRTGYTFSINTDSLADALDRFSHFFIDPLFNAENIAKELFAVDQEHAKNIENDSRRKFMVLKEICNQNHPFSYFTTGNAQTLGKIPNETLKDWYEKNYSADKMYLVIYSSKNLNELIDLAATKFSAIQNKISKKRKIPENLFLPENKACYVYIKPFTNIKTLEISWELPLSFSKDSTKSLDLIAYALQRGEENSLLSLLQKEQLAENFSVTCDNPRDSYALFSMNLKLTDKGLTNTNKIIEYCFSAINNYKNISQDAMSDIFAEMNKQESIRYAYQTNYNPESYISLHAFYIVEDDFETYPQNLVIGTNFDFAKIGEALSFLQPSNCQIYFIADPEKLNVKLDKKEKWVGAEYTVKKIESDKLNSWSKVQNKKISFPQKNPFIADNFDIIKSAHFQNTPVKIDDTSFSCFYYLPDNCYFEPTLFMKINLKDPSFSNDTKAYVLKTLYVKALNQKLKTLLQALYEANITVSAGQKNLDLTFDIFGFSEKIPLALDELLKQIKTVTISQEEFEIYKNALLTNFENDAKVLPISQALNYMSAILKNAAYKDPSCCIDKLNNLSYEAYLSFQENLYKNCYLEGMIGGNVTGSNALALIDKFKTAFNTFPFPKENHIRSKAATISQNGPYIISQNTSCLGNGVVLIIDEGDFTYQKKAAQSILTAILHEAFFTALRSEQKTAYITQVRDIEESKKLFRYFAIQSSSHDYYNLITRIEIFLESFADNILTQISKERFESVKQEQLILFQKPFQNFYEMGEFFSYLAFDKKEPFSYKETLIDQLKKLSYEDFITDAKKMLSRENRARLAIAFNGKISNDFNYKNFNNDTDLKKVVTYSSWQEQSN